MQGINVLTLRMYTQDVAYFKTISCHQLNILNCVMKWKPVLLMSPSSAAMLNNGSMPFACSICGISTLLHYHPFTGCTHRCVYYKSYIFYVTNQSSLLDIQAAGRISKLLAMMPPAVYAELTMLVAIQLHKGVENVFDKSACWT